MFGRGTTSLTRGALFAIAFITVLTQSLSDGSALVFTPLEAAVVEAQPDHSVNFELYRRLEELSSECPGTPSVSVLFIDRDEKAELNARRVVKAASVIKLPILAAVAAICDEDGISPDSRITLTEEDRTGGSGVLKARRFSRCYNIRELLELMIVESDNTATNALIRIFGIERINGEFEQMGLVATKLEHRILESSDDNPTSAAEITELVGRICDPIGGAHGLSADAKRMIMAVLTRTPAGDRLGRYLKNDATCLGIAHKTGTLKGIVHDAGIIEFSDERIVVSALIEGAFDRAAAEKWIGRLGRMLRTFANGSGE